MADYHIINAIWQYKTSPLSQGRPDSARQHLNDADPRRAYAARGALPARKPALTKAPLEALLATCTDGLIGLRDRALLLFAFSSGGRRRSEVSAAVVDQLVKVDDQTSERTAASSAECEHNMRLPSRPRHVEHTDADLGASR
jgi:integrase